MISIERLYWVAGLLEGEGCFMQREGRPVIEITMTDKDVIDCLYRLLGFGTLQQRQLPSGKTAYMWAVRDKEHAVGLMMTLLPLMSERRAKKIRECIRHWKNNPGRTSHYSRWEMRKALGL